MEVEGWLFEKGKGTRRNKREMEDKYDQCSYMHVLKCDNETLNFVQFCMLKKF
jgi:hypothetical protein